MTRPAPASVDHTVPAAASQRTAVDPGRLHLKSHAEAAATIAQMHRTDRGFLSRPHFFYLLYLAAIAAAVLRWDLALSAIAAVLAADWTTFMLRRRRALQGAERNPLRLHTSADSAAVDAAYIAQGRQQPTMADWIATARVAAGRPQRPDPDGRAGRPAGPPHGLAPPSPAREPAPPADDPRYLDIARVERALAPRPAVVVDVGANDGCARWQYGIGQDGLFVGIDISLQLLQRLRARLPDQGALLADGGALPLRTGCVDFLFCTETLEHLPEPLAAVAEFRRALRPGGRLMIQSPNAHRLRNLNVFHVLTLLAGLAFDRVLLKKTVHENTWHNAATYHWDFSRRDYQRMAAGPGWRIVALTGRGFFVPRSLLLRSARLERWKERVLASTPVVRYFGEDLVLIAERVAE